MKWEEVDQMDRNDLFAELEELAVQAEENAEAYESENYAWFRYAEAIRAAIEKLKE